MSQQQGNENVITIEQLLQAMQQLRLPQCVREKHTDTVTAVCTDQACVNAGLFLQCLCEQCQFDNVHARSGHKTASLKYTLRNLLEQAFDGRNEGAEQARLTDLLKAVARAKENLLSMRSEIDAQLARMDEHRAHLSAHLEATPTRAVRRLLADALKVPQNVSAKDLQRTLDSLCKYVRLDQSQNSLCLASGTRQDLVHSASQSNGNKQASANQESDDQPLLEKVHAIDICLKRFQDFDWDISREQLMRREATPLQTLKQMRPEEWELESARPNSARVQFPPTPRQQQQQQQQSTPSKNAVLGKVSLSTNAPDEIQGESLARNTHNRSVEEQKGEADTGLLDTEDAVAYVPPTQKQQARHTPLSANASQEAIGTSFANAQVLGGSNANHLKGTIEDAESFALSSARRSNDSKRYDENEAKPFDGSESKRERLSAEETQRARREAEEADRTVKMLHIKIQKLQSEMQSLKNDEESAKSEAMRQVIKRENDRKLLEKEKMVKESYQAIQFYKQKLAGLRESLSDE